MNGPEHFREAERLLVTADFFKSEEGDHAAAVYAVSRAHVHALLANAAATAMQPSGANGEFSAAEFKSWFDVCGSDSSEVEA